MEGKVLMERRRLKTLDVAAIRENAERYGRKVRRALAPRAL